uniref:Uncharacterized protein n=1 Tax=Pelusios castaneus TaxID=367368 RepID=A0A8C8RQY6_9SAUR
MLLPPTSLALMSLCQREEGRQCLRELLRWEAFDEVRDLRRSIELDLLYGSIAFAVEKGLPWPAVAEVGKFSGELLSETKDLPISRAIHVLKDKLAACEPKLSPFKPNVLCDYFYNTLIRHYPLYQFVLGQGRDIEQTAIHLEICVPPPPLPLTAGTNAEVWQYQQQLAALSAAEVQKRANLLLLRETLQLESEHMVQRMLETLVKEVVGTQIQALLQILQTEIQTTFEILELRLQKRALNLNPPAPYPPPPPPEERTKKAIKGQEQKKKRK